MAKPDQFNLPLEWVRAYESAGRTGSFTAAADELGLTQAAISQRIGNLERRLGSELFFRQARGVILTIDGEAWLPFVTGALDTIRHSADDMFSVDRNKITVSAGASMIELWLAQRLKHSSENLPGITFQTMILNSEASLQSPNIRVRYGSGDTADHYKFCLFDEELSPLAAPDLLAQSDNWRVLPRISVLGPRPGWQDWSRFSGDHTTPVPSLRFDTFACALAAARAGLGVLLASLPLCKAEIQSGQLVRVSKDTLIPGQGQWMLAQEDAISRRQWKDLTDLFSK